MMPLSRITCLVPRARIRRGKGSLTSEIASQERDQMQQSNLAVRLTNGRSLPIQLVTGRKDLLNSDSTEGHKARRRREIQFAQLPSGTLIDLMRDMSGE